MLWFSTGGVVNVGSHVWGIKTPELTIPSLRHRSSANDSLLVALFLLSGATLFFEVLLTRIFSVFLWSHYAFFVVSLALLGFGASGTFLSLIEGKPHPHSARLRASSFLLFFLTAFAVYLGITRIPFDPVRLPWDPWQFVWISLFYLFAAAPFFFSGLYIAFTFKSDPSRIHFLYGLNLTGSALGAVAPLLLLHLPLVGIQLSPYKALPQLLRYPESRIVATAWSPIARGDLVQSGGARFAPGLSLRYRGVLPDQVGLTLDGDRLNAVTRFDGDFRKLSFLSSLPSVAAYTLLSQPEVLVLEGGGGIGILEALYHGSDAIDVLERNRDVVDLVEGLPFSGQIYHHPQVHWTKGASRNFLRRSLKIYDLISLSLADLPSAGTTGLYGQNENYLFTVEAFTEYLGHLKEGGIFTVTRPLLFPPREAPRTIALAREALATQGSRDPARHLAVIESWGTWTLILKKTNWREAELKALGRFARDRNFRLVPMKEYEALLGDARYPFDLSPTTDDRPFFLHFFKLTKLKEAYRSLGGKWEAFLEGGYLVYGALALALFWGFLLILFPAVIRRRPVSAPLRVCLYFSSIGLAFIFVEMSLLQRAVLLFGDPTYGLALLLAGLLLLTGLGSFCSNALSGRRSKVVFGGLAVGMVMLALLKGPAISIVLSLPILFFMGMPFPLALKKIDSRAIPLAWAANGVASVIGAVAAVALALEWGYSRGFMAAGFFYLLAALFLRRLQ